MSFITHLSRLTSDDRAENSIMQTISIAVSAILIASGLVTAPGLINNARDNNAKTDLANIAYAQEFAHSTGGDYFKNILPNQPNSLFDYLKNESNDSGTAIKYTTSGEVAGHAAAVCNNPDFFILKDQSASGKWFYRGSASGVTSTNINEIEIPPAVLAGCSGLLDAFEEVNGNNPPATNPGNITSFVNAFDHNENFGWTDTITNYDGFPIALNSGDISYSASATRVFIGAIEVPITHSVTGDIYMNSAGITVDGIKIDLIAAGYTLEDFWTNGWVSMTINGIPGNNIRFRIAANSPNDPLALETNTNPAFPNPRDYTDVDTYRDDAADSCIVRSSEFGTPPVQNTPAVDVQSYWQPWDGFGYAPGMFARYDLAADNCVYEVQMMLDPSNTSDLLNLPNFGGEQRYPEAGETISFSHWDINTSTYIYDGSITQGDDAFLQMNRDNAVYQHPYELRLDVIREDTSFSAIFGKWGNGGRIDFKVGGEDVSVYHYLGSTPLRGGYINVPCGGSCGGGGGDPT